MGVSGWMFLLVPAYPGCPGSKAVKLSLLLLYLTINRKIFSKSGRWTRSPCQVQKTKLQGGLQWLHSVDDVAAVWLMTQLVLNNNLQLLPRAVKSTGELQFSLKLLQEIGMHIMHGCVLFSRYHDMFFYHAQLSWYASAFVIDGTGSTVFSSSLSVCVYLHAPVHASRGILGLVCRRRLVG